jgi:hypothetical protein
MVDEVAGFQGLNFGKEASSNFFQMKQHYSTSKLFSLSSRKYAARVSVNDNYTKIIHKYFNNWFRI